MSKREHKPKDTYRCLMTKNIIPNHRMLRRAVAGRRVERPIDIFRQIYAACIYGVSTMYSHDVYTAYKYVVYTACIYGV